MSRTLVIGGAGFIGSHLVPLLDEEVTIVDNLHPQVHKGAAPGWLNGRTFVPVDVLDRSSLLALLTWFRPDKIFHLAAETGTGQSLAEPSRHCGVNVLGLSNVLEALIASGSAIQRIVLPSSRAVYGEGAWLSPDGALSYPPARTLSELGRGSWTPWANQTPVPHDAARHWPRPTNVYAATKLAQEHLLTCWALGHDVQAQVLRLQNVYGPGQAPNNPYTGVLVHFAQTALAGDRIPVYEDGAIIRDFVHVADVARALVAAGHLTEGVGVIDIGSGQGATLWEVARIVAEAAGGPEPVITGQFRVGDVRAASASTELADSVLGVRAEVGLSEGIRGLVEHLRKT